jgi:hypothetical protein
MNMRRLMPMEAGKSKANSPSRIQIGPIRRHMRGTWDACDGITEL